MKSAVILSDITNTIRKNGIHDDVIKDHQNNCQETNRTLVLEISQYYKIKKTIT